MIKCVTMDFMVIVVRNVTAVTVQNVIQKLVNVCVRSGGKVS